MMENKQMDDRLISMDILASQKFLSTTYCNAADEATNPRLRHEFLSLEREEHEWANILFNALHKRGWYETTEANPETVRQLRDEFTGPSTPQHK